MIPEPIPRTLWDPQGPSKASQGAPEGNLKASRPPKHPNSEFAKARLAKVELAKARCSEANFAKANLAKANAAEATFAKAECESYIW